MPQVDTKFIRLDIEKSMSLMQTVIELGRVMRDRRTVPLKTPLTEIIVIHRDPASLAAIERLSDFILSELNVRKLTLSSEKSKYGVTLRADPDHKVSLKYYCSYKDPVKGFIHKVRVSGSKKR